MVKLMDESADFLIKDTVTSAVGVRELFYVDDASMRNEEC